MARLPNENIYVDLYQNYFENIGQDFLQSVVSIFSFITALSSKKEFLLMTKEATYAYGEGICSSLSLEHDISKPQRISCLDDMKIVQVDYGWNFVVILTDDSRVYLASNYSRWKTNKTFRLINTGNNRFKMIAGGWSHLLLLRRDGHVFAMGDNNRGQITGNEESSYESMIHIDNLENVEIISCGFDNSFSITKKGEIYSWGNNVFGQLGLGDEKNRNTPCLVAFPYANSTQIKDIVAGDRHSLFLFENGQLWGCGYNELGQLGIGDDIKRSITPTKIPIENVQQIACSKDLSLAYDGSSYYAWDKTNISSPKKLDDHPTSFSFASVQVLNSPLTFDLTSTIYIFGSHDSISYQCKSITQLFDNQDSYDLQFIIDEKRIKASKCYLKSVSEYYRRMFSGVWSEDDQVPIENYSYEAYYSYLRMLHTAKIHINRQNITELVDLANRYGDDRLIKYCETFIRNDLNEQTMPTYLPLINKYEIKVLHNKLRNMTRSRNENIDIKLFQNDFKNIDQKFLQSVVSIFSFFPSQCFEMQFLLMTKEATYAYGEEICSWLSLEHERTKPQRISRLNYKKIVQVDSGYRFVAILTDEGQVFLVSVDYWKTNKALRLINTGNDLFKMIACGWSHLLMLREDGHVFAVGDNSCGQITGNEESSYESMIHIDNLENVELIACGVVHSFSINNKGEIYSWGYNNCGQLGLGDEKNRNTPCLVAFPYANSTQIKDIVAGRYHSLFLFENGQLWGSGSNSDGELGLGDDIKRSITPTKILIENVQQMECSKEYKLSLAHDGSSYYVWGETKYGKWSSPRKLDDHPTSFVAASAMILSSALTFCLTSTIYVFGSHDTISYQCKPILHLFNNQDSYDVKFIIDKKRIKANKCYLKSVSEYYRLMFSGNWSENDQVIINDYSYETYYAYLLMLHTGKIHINHQNITELVDLANCYGDKRLMEYCKIFIRNEQTTPAYLPLINKYEINELHDKLRNKIMARSPTENIDIGLFQDDFKKIGQEFLQSIVSIFSFTLEDKNEFLLMTEEYTFAYGEEICSWLSLGHDRSKPQRISRLNDVKIVQVDSGHDFVAILTDDGQVFLASDVYSKWETYRTLRLISNDNDRFKMIACGQYHLLLLRQDCHVFAIGDNSCGQLTGYKESSFVSMIHIDNLENVELIACGAGHSLSITNKGEFYSWGLNDCGQLGLADKEDQDVPCLVAFPNDDSTRIKDIVAGYQHSLFLFENGQLWGCGSNKNGELGLGDKKKRSKLTKIPIENVQQIACSKFHNFSLTHDGSSYYACGNTKYGKWSSPRRLNGYPTSFVAASAIILESPITFDLTSTIYVFGSHDSISYQCKLIIQLFDNQDSYDVEFLIDEKHIKASKCYLQSVSEYYRRRFSGNWSENDQVIINDYSYETYYAYLRMLHTGKIHINRQNITELVDLANCYGDERLMKYCATFIRNDLDEQTMPTYRTLIIKYEIKELYDKIAHLDKNRQQSSSKRTKFF